MNVRTTLLALALGSICTGAATAGHPILSLFTKQPTGAYQTVVPRYVVIDPVPAATTAHLGHHGAVDPYERLQWQRNDLPEPAYPYGWFGARHATTRWSTSGYYGSYTDVRTLRGQ